MFSTGLSIGIFYLWAFSNHLFWGFLLYFSFVTTCPIVTVQHCVGWSLNEKNTKYKSAQDVFAGLKYLPFHFILFSPQLDQLNDPGVSLDILAKFGHLFNYTHLFLIAHLHLNHFTSKWTTTVFDKIRKKMNKKDWIWLDMGIKLSLPEILMIKESCNLIEPDANLDTPNQE